MLKKATFILFIFFIIPFLSYIYSQKITTRTPYDIPLINLKSLAEKNELQFKKVRVAIDDNKEYAIITKLHDFHIKNTRKGREKTTYVEAPATAFALTDFEKRHFERVVQSLISTLVLFERDLESNQLDKCLYLDSFFPRFMKGFYHLNCAAVNSISALPPQASIPDDWYEVSLRSKLSEKRIETWLGKKDYTIKLRIAARELIFQLKNWQKKKLRNYKKNPQVEFNQNLKDTYCLFVKLYFNSY